MTSRWASFFSERARRLRASEIRELLKIIEERKNIISLAGGLPDPRTFPKEEIAEAARKIVLERGDKALQYSPTKGVAFFLDAVREFLSRNNIAVRRGDDIIATVGSQQALYLVAKVFIDPGDYVVTEEPSYLGAINAFRHYDARFLTIPLDEDGMRTDILEERVKRAVAEGKRLKMIYTVPTCHNPAGSTMPDERRKHLLEVAEHYDLLVVEDDPYGFITFSDKPFTALKNLDKTGRVIYMSTMSKILAPGIRLGWVLADSEIVAKLELAKQAVDLHTPTLSQFIAGELLRSGLIERRFPMLRKIYREKRDAMLEALEENMPEGSRWTRPVGGLFVFVWLPEGINTRKLLDKALEKGVAYVPGDAFYPNGGGENTMRLNFSYPPVDMIREGVRRIGEAIREMTRGRR
ncbi:MAG: PLP-dependent aminotransferase family protein [Pyrodictiaceae archaeon]